MNRRLLAPIGALLACACSAGAPPEPAYRNFGAARVVVIRGYVGDAMEPFVTRDGRFLLFNNRNGAGDQTDLFYAARIDDVTFVYRGPLAGANSAALDGVASVDDRGVLFFISARSYDRTLATIYRAKFDDGVVTQAAIVPGIVPARRGLVDFDAEISADGSTLYYVEGDFSGGGGVPSGATIRSARRGGTGYRPDPSDTHVLAAVNDGFAYAPCVSRDGLELFFTRAARGMPPTVWRAARTAADRPFGAPARVTAAVGFVEAPSLSGDGRRLYFHRKVGNRFALFEAGR